MADRLPRQPGAQGVLAHVVLQQRREGFKRTRRIRQRREQMQRRGEPDRRSEHVGDYSDVVGARHRGDFPELGEAAAHAHVRLNDVQCAFLNHAAESPAATKLLCTGYPDVQGTANLNIPFDVIGGNGLFEPQEVVFREPPAHRYGRTPVIATIGIDREQNVVTDGAAHCCDILDVVVRAEADLHLHRLEARIGVAACFRYQGSGFIRAITPEKAGSIGLDAIAKSAAQQVMDRLIKGFAHDVPQGDVYGADRRGIGALLVQALPDYFVVKGIAADDVRLDSAACRHGSALAPSGNPAVGEHFDNTERPLTGRAHRVGEGFLHRIDQRVGLDVNDFHS